MSTEMAILTPEKAVVTFRVASLGSRVSAHLIDILAIIGMIIFIQVVTGFLMVMSGSAVPAALMIFSISMGPFIYFILFEGLWNGQTIGKKTMGIRVRRIDGTPITFGGAMARNFLRVADFLPGAYFFGLVFMFTNPRSQRLGDMAAGTIVVHDRRVVPVFTPAPYVLGKHPWEDHVGDLRKMSSEEYFALKRMCDRFPELSTSVQERMIVTVWKPVSARLSIPEAANVHPIYLAEATVMKFGRAKGLM